MDEERQSFMSTGKHYFIEPGEENYRVIAANAKRVSGVAKTEEEAIALAKKFNPDDHPDVARVRRTKTGGPDQWRAVKKRGQPNS
jgi:hypothetical protein